MTAAGQTHQATAVAIGGRAVMIEGPPGSGKSSLALALIDRGAQLVGDDGLLLLPDIAPGNAPRLLAQPHPRIAGLLEVRNLGLLRFPHLAQAPVALVLRLDADAPRFIDAAGRVERAGIAVPMVQLWPETPMLVLRATLALEHYGLG
ncbi:MULTISPECIES: HPr kinase/phosphorylase [unclassified Novosphingobium]|uniref:HPr kinase/phosphorylase n=1 Tax=unclassified Novosphingobium TaxID=2644732 RepID=UPI000D321968|nr:MULTISPECIES: serine kinase [unclassified Novosphingobium]PTR08805.1 Hpr(Ser) kinase/phosphatase [Novosphingobium sp. GV055]PUB01717.1 Hpr(Ser) kinase/phosphatase [Novosphingobium sp. GV061]PUB17689.1 Hpr(Ser) kinase/phosphatase [Novosphingobium sp. GV079]PUB40383.1 Hpr(Ser) kinase/phosphatase [Novosphingobium sp. GV027]